MNSLFPSIPSALRSLPAFQTALEPGIRAPVLLSRETNLSPAAYQSPEYVDFLKAYKDAGLKVIRTFADETGTYAEITAEVRH